MVLSPAQVSLDAFMHEFFPEKIIPADVEIDAFTPAYFEAGAQEAPMRDDLVSYIEAPELHVDSVN